MSALDQYIENMSSPEDALLHELERETYLRVLNPRMISGHVQGKLLEMIVRMIRPQRVLEIGTFTGYSALSMAAGLPEGGVIDTCEVDDELEMFILDFFERSQYAERLNLHIGSALETMTTLNKVYDLVFIDGDKREYTAYYNMLFDKGLVSSGSWIMADNILWYGKVTEPARHGDHHTEALQEFNRLVRDDERVQSVILPLRDGLNIIRKK